MEHNHSSQKDVYTGQGISENLKPESGEVMLMSYNFPSNAWREDSPLGKKLREWYESGIKIRAVGGPEIEAEQYLLNLVKEGVADIKILSKPKKEHLCIATNPSQLFCEREHTTGHAKNVYYTNNPYPDVFDNAVKIFENLWEEGAPLIT